MTEKDYKPKHHEKGMESKAQQKPADVKQPAKVEPAHAHDHEHSHEHEHAEHKHEEKKEDKKKQAVQIVKKEEAFAKGLNLHASKKHCMYISDFIKNKPIDQAISELQDVVKMKRAIPFKGEIPHRKGKMMSGRYPVKASKQIINILKALKGNSIVNGLDLDKTRISFASANWDSRPAKKGGMRFKRAQVLLKAREISIPEVKEKK